MGIENVIIKENGEQSAPRFNIILTNLSDSIYHQTISKLRLKPGTFRRHYIAAVCYRK